MQHGAQRRSLPSPEAKQAATEISRYLVRHGILAVPDIDLEQTFAEKIDTATAKLREENQRLQGQSIGKMCPHCNKGKIFLDTHHCTVCNYRVYYEEIEPSSTTPDLEKIARECANEVMQRYDGGCRREDTVEPIRVALAQVREPLVGLLRRARRNVEHSASHPAGAASRELLAEIDVALTNTGKRNDRSQT